MVPVERVVDGCVFNKSVMGCLWHRAPISWHEAGSHDRVVDTFCRRPTSRQKIFGGGKARLAPENALWGPMGRRCVLSPTPFPAQPIFVKAGLMARRFFLPLIDAKAFVLSFLPSALRGRSGVYPCRRCLSMASQYLASDEGG